MSDSMFPFVNTTTYDQKALVALNTLAEKSVRKEKTRRTQVLSLVLGLLLIAGGAAVYGMSNLAGSLLMVYGVMLFLLSLYRKKFQLKSTQRQLQQGMQVCTYAFDDDEFICTTAVGQEHYAYEQIFAVVCDQNWYVLFFDAAHGVILDRKGFTEGEDMFFKTFIGQHTKLPIQEF